MISKILIANRGEIARRIIRTAHKMGIATVGIYTSEEPNAAWSAESGESAFLDGIHLKDTYLNSSKIIALAKQFDCDAIHPGYGFLSENAEFARLCVVNNITFIGPKPEVIELMGNKLSARKFAIENGLAIPFGIEGSMEEIVMNSNKLPYPVIIKASAGGGGKGMHIVYSAEELSEKIASAQREALTWFGNGSVYVEQYFENARHIEVQVVGDNFGNYLHLFERECTLQRNYQKVIEEAPSPTLSEPQRNAICSEALKLAKAAKYNNVGTIEFLWANDQFFFLEMNTRIQVEHPVTEMITGIDLVEQQILICQNLEIILRQKDIKINGWSVEARIYAENPEKGFKPSGGFMHLLQFPSRLNARIESTYKSASEISTSFDGLIAKVIVQKTNRNEALSHLSQVLDKTIVHGVDSNTKFLSLLLNHPDIVTNRIHTKYLHQNWEALKNSLVTEKKSISPIIPIIGYVAALSSKNTKDESTIWDKTGPLSNVSKQTINLDGVLYEFQLYRTNLRYEILWNNILFSVFINQLTKYEIWFVLDGMEHKLFFSKGSDSCWIQYNGILFRAKSLNILDYVTIIKKKDEEICGGNFNLVSPLHGIIAAVNVIAGQKVEQGTTVLTIESMKTENHISCPSTGIVEKIWIEQNHGVKENQLLVSFIN